MKQEKSVFETDSKINIVNESYRGNGIKFNLHDAPNTTSNRGNSKFMDYSDANTSRFAQMIKLHQDPYKLI